jgi:hypothetical protein
LRQRRNDRQPGPNRHAAPSAALTIEHRDDEGDSDVLTGQSADHLDVASCLAEGALEEIRVPAVLPVLGWETQMDGEALEVSDENDRRRIGVLPLRPEAVQAPFGALRELVSWTLS